MVGAEMHLWHVLYSTPCLFLKMDFLVKRALGYVLERIIPVSKYLPFRPFGRWPKHDDIQKWIVRKTSWGYWKYWKPCDVNLSLDIWIYLSIYIEEIQKQYWKQHIEHVVHVVNRTWYYTTRTLLGVTPNSSRKIPGFRTTSTIIRVGWTYCASQGSQGTAPGVKKDGLPSGELR